MIVYGTRNKQLLSQELLDTCSHCNTANNMEIHIFQKYFTLFWIPFIPLSKLGVTQCNHCKQVLKDKEMPPNLKHTYDRLKATTKTPWWTFIGLGILCLLIYNVQASIKEDNKRTAQYLTSPQKGDIYEVKTKSNNYTLYKIDKVAKDSIYFEINEYEVNKISGLDKFHKKPNSGFSGIVLPISKVEVQKMKAEGNILDVRR